MIDICTGKRNGIGAEGNISEGYLYVMLQVKNPSLLTHKTGV
jgi:hypothetical protein